MPTTFHLRLTWLPVLLALAPASAWAQSAEAARPAKIGGLHRAAATLDSVLNVYRLALVELVPAARRIREAGQPVAKGDETALHVPAPLTPVPTAAREVFGRLAASLAARVPAEALPVIPRGYHAEVIDALDRLNAATTLAEAVEPLEALSRAMGHVCDSGDAIVDLFSRARPIQTRLIDSASVLEDVSEALDEVAAAERSILEARKRHAALGDQLQAFLRLEVSLGHALDLIAGAQEAGLLIGFEAQLSTRDFAGRLARLRAQLAQLDGVVADLRRPPAPVTGALRVDLVETAGSAGEARLRWTPPAGTPRPAALRIYRRANLPAMREVLAAAYRCEGKDGEQAGQLAASATQDGSDDWIMVSEEAPGIASFTETWHELPVAPPVYRVVAVSPFGIEGKGQKAPARFIPRRLEGASEVRARSLAPPPDDPSFYSDYDLVEVTWRLSPSDPADRSGLGEGTPLVESYRVLRQSEGHVDRVGEVGPRTRSLVDRVPPALLAQGVRYSVEAVSAEHGLAGPPEGCKAAEPLRVDLREPMRLARLGLAALERPRVQREEYDRLADPLQLGAARDAFLRRPTAARRELLASWWTATPRSRRLQWLAAWPSFVSAEHRGAWIAEAAEHLCAADLPLAKVEVWLASQPPEIQDEIDRWWELLDRKSRERAARELRDRLSPAGRKWLDEQRQAGNDSAMRPARVLAWYESRDPEELARLDEWWQGLGEEARSHGTRAWLQGQPEPLQEALRWPAWDRLTGPEHERMLAAPPSDLPDPLWREALGWLEWHEVVQAGGERLEQAVVAETTAPGRLARRLRWALRPVDVLLGFQLPWVALGLLVVVPAGIFLLVRRRGRATSPRGEESSP